MLVFVSVELIVKFGYEPLTEVAPLPVSETVLSGAALLKVVPLNVRPDPAV